MKKITLAVCLFAFTLPVLAADSQSAESIRYYNSSGAFDKQINYYGLNKTTNTAEDDSEVVLDPPAKTPKRAPRQIKVNNDDDDDLTPSQSYADAMGKRTPMTYEQFPKNYDSSNSMMLMQGGMGGMMPGMF